MTKETKPAAGPEKQPRRIVQWAEIEPHYRAGIRPLKDLGAEYGVSAAGICKHANKKGWTRNLLAKVQAKADALVNAAAVNAEVNAEKTLTEKVVVDANADLQATVRLGHRKDIARSRSLFACLMDEMELTTGNKALFEQLGSLLDETSESDSGRIRQDKINEIYSKVISLPGRVDSAKKLVEMLEKLVRMEREAFGIDKEDGADSPLDVALKIINAMKHDGIQPD